MTTLKKNPTKALKKPKNRVGDPPRNKARKGNTSPKKYNVPEKSFDPKVQTAAERARKIEIALDRLEKEVGPSEKLSALKLKVVRILRENNEHSKTVADFLWHFVAWSEKGLMLMHAIRQPREPVEDK